MDDGERVLYAGMVHFLFKSGKPVCVDKFDPLEPSFHIGSTISRTVTVNWQQFTNTFEVPPLARLVPAELLPGEPTALPTSILASPWHRSPIPDVALGPVFRTPITSGTLTHLLFTDMIACAAST